MPPVSQQQRKAMFAAAAGKSTLGIPRKVGQEFVDADPGGKLPARKAGRGGSLVKSNFAKGTGPTPATYAEGGEVLTQRSRFAKSGGPTYDRSESVLTEQKWPQKSKFMATPDVYRTGEERNDYEKKGKKGELANPDGDTKSLKPIKPRV